MSGVWGSGGPRCQAALAVLASLCRARPPPLGLDVETCRSFELQPPERSPSAADAGNAEREAPSPAARSPGRPLPRGLWPRSRSPERELRLGIPDSRQPRPVPWPGARSASGETRRGPGTGGAPAPRSAAPLSGPRGNRDPGRWRPSGPQFPSRLSARPAGDLPGEGSAERVGDQGHPSWGGLGDWLFIVAIIVL